MLMSELAHMRKLYNDIIYFVQNHVKPVAPSNSFPSSLLLPSSATTPPINGSSLMQKPLNQLIGYNYGSSGGHKQNHPPPQVNISFSNSPNRNSHSHNSSSVTIIEDREINRTKLFGVPIQSKKRLHPADQTSMETNNKTRLVMEKDDLGLNLMPPSPC